MNGIDIAGHQKGINLSVVPCDFVIVKATQGKTFVNPEFTTQITQALSLGKCAGVYHYANGAGVDIEADHFVDVIKPYLGRVILAIDWENNKDRKTGANDNPKFVAGDYKYCEQLLMAVKQRTGVTPFLYMSKSVARQFKWEVGRNFPFWCAQYKKSPPTTYVNNPWTDDKGWGAWTGCKILQYSSKGRLKGYNSDLDLDLSYMNADEWAEYCKPIIQQTQPSTPNGMDDLLKPTLRKGDRGEAVRAWQMYLNEHGYYCGNADGIFGQKTQDAVVKYQQDKGMEAGIIGAQTWATLPF